MPNRLINWIEHHPRTGWYTAVLTTANFLLLFIDRL